MQRDFEKHGNFLAVKKVMLRLNRKRNLILSIFTLLFLLGLIKYNNNKQEISLTKRSIKGSQSSIEEHDNQQNDDIQNSFDIEVDGANELTENSILPKWNHKTKFAFIHIGKTGGTSFDAGMRKWLNINILNTKLYIGKRHYDWSYYKNLKDESSQEIHPLTWLRHPVDRAISHFNFMKQLAWTKGTPIRQTSLSDFLSNYEMMMDFRGAWQDGQAGTAWISGLHIADWVWHYPKPRDKDQIELSFLDMESVLDQVATRFEKELFWFGILDEKEKSIEMLNYQLDTQFQIEMVHLNKGKNKLLHEDSSVDEFDRKKLEWLMPYDMWLYNYASELLNAKWNFYKNGAMKMPDRPPYPRLTCISTRYILTCEKGPFGNAFYYYHPSTPPDHIERFNYLKDYYST